MERNTKTTIAELAAGDRFYKVKDKNKIVHTKVEHEAKQTFFQTYQHFALKDGERFEAARDIWM